MPAPMGMDTLVPAWFACRRLKISKQLLNHWRTSGKLVPAARDSAGRPQYRYGDVLEVDRQTRRSKKSSRYEPAPA